MYRKDVLGEPTVITRPEFVNLVFYNEDLSPDSKYQAVALADRFIHTNNCYPLSLKNLACDPLSLNAIPCARQYTQELAAVVGAIAGEVNEEDYDLTQVVYQFRNRYVIKLHWEVCQSVNFTIPRGTFLHLIFYHWWPTIYNSYPTTFIENITKRVCHIPNFIQLNPITIVMAIMLLLKHKKLT